MAQSINASQGRVSWIIAGQVVAVAEMDSKKMNSCRVNDDEVLLRSSIHGTWGAIVAEMYNVTEVCQGRSVPKRTIPFLV